MFVVNYSKKQSYFSVKNSEYVCQMAFYKTVRFLFLVYVWLGRLCGWIPPAQHLLMSDVEIYEKKYKTEFLKYYDNEVNTTKNENIIPIFYDNLKLKESMKIENNDIEKQWKTRVLIEYTPRGNIIMFYDAYKCGFSYYSDHSVIPVKILDCVAMKYTMKYRCLDFFVDEKVLEKNASPIIKLWKDECKEVWDKKKRLLANLRTPTANKVGNNPANFSEKIMNKYIYLGKVNNFSFIQKQKYSSLHNTDDCEKLFKNVNYEEYKLMMRKNKIQ
jgi:hypothetical protein